MKKVFLLLIAVSLLLVTACKNPEATEKWCVMEYMDFSNLSHFALGNLEEICESSPNSNVKAYFLTGGSDSYCSLKDYPALSSAIDAFNPEQPFLPSSSPNTYQLWEYTSDGVFRELTSPIKGMNDPDVLAQFIESCILMTEDSGSGVTYKYILDLWNHGAGSYAGLIGDFAIKESKNEDLLMSLADCGKSIREVTDRLGFRFEAVIFDMCLMQSVESALAVSPSAASYIIGSQASSAGIGPAYTDWYNYLYSNPYASGLAFAKYFCDTAYDKLYKYGASSYLENVTWSVLDMSKFAAVEEAYDAYAASELSSLDASSVEKYTGEIEELPAFSNGYWDWFMYDISVFTAKVGSSAARSELLNAVSDAVVYKRYGSIPRNAGCCGLSMCILTDSKAYGKDWKKYGYSSGWNSSYLDTCLTPEYRKFQQRITGI